MGQGGVNRTEGWVVSASKQRKQASHTTAHKDRPGKALDKGQAARKAQMPLAWVHRPTDVLVGRDGVGGEAEHACGWAVGGCRNSHFSTTLKLLYELKSIQGREGPEAVKASELSYL